MPTAEDLYKSDRRRVLAASRELERTATELLTNHRLLVSDRDNFASRAIAVLAELGRLNAVLDEPTAEKPRKGR